MRDRYQKGTMLVMLRSVDVLAGDRTCELGMRDVNCVAIGGYDGDLNCSTVVKTLFLLLE
jgi:hypothetical protein